MSYPDKKMLVKALSEAAERAGMESSANHPEDIAYAMINAIETGAVMLEILWKTGKI